jgi:pantoate--beta-alanine ligase
MKTVTTVSDVRKAMLGARERGATIGFVPTMGALHEGHLSLVRAARDRADYVVVSIFVNPTQFGPNEDLAKYPRNLEKDAQLLETAHADLIFAPSVDEVYGTGAHTWVEVEGLSNRNEGRIRPGHFRGVATVVAKLFNIVQPDTAFFGQKDAAQLSVIRRMTHDLRFPVEIIACPIVRERDGLAMSSRNVYLNPDERKRALVLHRALEAAESVFNSGQTDAAQITGAARSQFDRERIAPDYIELLDPDTLEPVSRVTKPTLLAVAAKVGTTRLLDNTILIPR